MKKFDHYGGVLSDRHQQRRLIKRNQFFCPESYINATAICEASGADRKLGRNWMDKRIGRVFQRRIGYGRLFRTSPRLSAFATARLPFTLLKVQRINADQRIASAVDAKPLGLREKSRFGAWHSNRILTTSARRSRSSW